MSQNTFHLSGFAQNNFHILPLRVQMEDTDAGGITYYANYLKFAERGRAASLAYLGYPHSKIIEEWGVMFVVRKCSVDYIAPACLDDDLEITTTFGVEGRLKIWADQEVKKQGQVLVCLKTLLVSVGKDLRLRKIPESLLEILKTFSKLD